MQCPHSLYSFYSLPHAIQFLFVATCHTVSIRCRMPYSFYSLPHAIQFLFIGACHTISIHCRMPYSFYSLPLRRLLHAVPFAICCCMLCSLVFVTKCCTVCYLLLHAMQFRICCRMPCILLLLLHAV